MSNEKFDRYPEYDGLVTILPIQIRENVIVRIQGIPFDLTKNEAAKIADVIIAMGQRK